MKRNLLTIQQGQHKVMEVVRIEGEEAPGPNDGNAGFRAFWDFFNSLSMSPTILRHSVECPTKFVLSHNGRCWAMETHALTDAPPDRA